MKKVPCRKNSYVVFLFSIIACVHYSYAQCEELEEQINRLEKRISDLEVKVAISPDSLTTGKQTTSDSEKENYPAYKTKPIKQTEQSPGKRVVTRVESISNILKSRILEKEVKSTGRGRGVSLLIAYTNIGRKDIVSFKGTISLEDQIGNVLTNYFIDINLKIPSLESKSCFSEVPFSNDYSEGYKRLFALKAEEITPTLNLTEIVFSDGTVSTKY